MSDPQLSGHGLGLRKPHYADFLTGAARVDFVEVISENFMIDGGKPRDILRRVRANYPVALHGVSLSVGSADGVDPDYLNRLRALVDEIEPYVVSDHLCWTRIGGFNSHDLLPVPYTEEALKVVCDNVDKTQCALGRSMLLENPSSYVSWPGADLTEWEFLNEVSRRSGCGLLLDVNNVFVSGCNHGFDPLTYLDAVPADRVRQIHLAGHSEGRSLKVDTHDAAIIQPVWDLYRRAIERCGPVATMIERDDNIPPLDDLLQELSVAREISATVVERRAA